MERRRGGSLAIFLAFLAGGVVGAALTFLFAPVSGREARKRIKETAEEIREKTLDKVEEVRERITGAVEEAKTAVKAAVEAGKEAFKQTKQELEKGREAES